MPFLLEYLTKRSVLPDLGRVLVVISCICYVSDLQNCDLVWATHVFKHGLRSVSLKFLRHSTFFATKIICGEAHHHEVWSHLKPVLWCSDTK